MYTRFVKAALLGCLALLSISGRATAAEPTVFGLIQTPGFNELTTYDLTQAGGFGYDATSVIPLNITNLLPQNSITSIAVQGSNLYGLIQTSGFNELITYDLTQTGGFGYDATSVIPLNITNLLPQNSITSIAVQGSNLYGLIQTPGFNELTTYDLTQTGGFGYDATSVIPLNITNLLPQNSIVGIAIAAEDGMSSAVPELSTWAMMLIGFFCIGVGFRQRPRFSYEGLRNGVCQP